jgi:short-subunit dehydrogenase
MSPSAVNRAVLTGATGGIGRELARELARRDFRLVLAGRDREALTELARELPGAVLGLGVGDLRNPDARERLRAMAAEHRVNMLINLCGVNDLCLLERQRAESVATLLEANLLVPIELTRLMLPDLQRQPRAWVVNVGSVLGAIGQPGYAVYCASKFGLKGFSEALRRELADSSVRVVYVAPRATRTAMNDATANTLNEALGNSVDDPVAVARRIADAAQSGRPVVTVGRPERFFTLLNGLAPRLVDRGMRPKLARTHNIIGASRVATETQDEHTDTDRAHCAAALQRVRNGT